MRYLAAVVALCLTTSASAQRALPDEISLEELVRIVRERAPTLAITDAELGEVEAEDVEARIRANPVFSFDTARLASGENVNGIWQYNAALSQTLPQRRVRQRAIEAASNALDAARIRREAIEAALVREARTRFVEIWSREARIEVLERALIEVNGLSEILLRRSLAGANASFDVQRFAVESRRLETDLLLARTSLVAARIELGRLVGVPSWSPRLTAGAPNAVVLPTTGGDASNRATVRASTADVRTATARLGAARARARPAPSLTASGLFTRRPRSAAVLLGVSIPLPVFDRNQGEIRRASASLEAASRREGAAISEAQVDLAQARARHDGVREALSALDTQVAERFTALRAMVEAGRVGGAIDAFVSLDALRAVRELEGMRVDLEAQALLSDIELAYALGL